MRASFFRDDAVARLKLMPSESVDMVLTGPPVAIDVRERPNVWYFPDTDWVAQALRVSRGPVVYYMNPDSFLKWQHHSLGLDETAPDQLMVWMIESAAQFSAGRGTVGADYNLICVHRPGRKRINSSDVILGRPGLEGAAKTPWSEAAKMHPALGSFDLAAQLTTIWGAKSVLDPFCGVGVMLEGAGAAGAEELIGIDIDADYLGIAKLNWPEATIVDAKPDLSLTVGRV